PHALGQDVAPVSEHADDFLDAGLQKRTGLEMQVGGNIVQVQADHAVGRGVQDLAKFQPHAGLAVLFITKLQAKVGLAATDLCRAAVSCVGVGHLGLPYDVSGKDVLLLRSPRLDMVAADQRQAQVDRGIAGVGRNIQGQRLLLGAQFEQRTVGENAAGLADHQLAGGEKLMIDLQLEETPAAAGLPLGTDLQLVVVVAIVLLEVLRTQQHAFLPDNLDRKSTRLNSSHVKISYPVFCL